MQMPASDRLDLPEIPRPLGLELSFPLSSLESLQRGHESQNQDEKWSIYSSELWIQIWRPSRTGLYCYAIRFERTEDQRLRIVESWIGDQILSSKWWAGNLEGHRKLVKFILEGLAGNSVETQEGIGVRFKSEAVSGWRRPKSVSFSGEVTNLSDVEKIAETIKFEVALMLENIKP